MELFLYYIRIQICSLPVARIKRQGDLFWPLLWSVQGFVRPAPYKTHTIILYYEF